MNSSKDLAKAVGGKTARACDSCIKKRARWYCAADDAFLCQSCDSSVHSANQLARRHERVRLKTASLKTLDLGPKEDSGPSWHGGFTRKARTPRHGKSVYFRTKKEETASDVVAVFPLVPEVGSDDISNEDNNDEEEHLLYRVPIYDPFVSELCTSMTPDGRGGIESKAAVGIRKQEVDCLHGFLQSDMDLAEFAADVESLLGKGLENESFGMEELGLMDCREEEREINGRIKVEKEAEDGGLRGYCGGGGGGGEEEEIDMGRDQVAPFEFSFEFDESSGATCTVDEGGGEKKCGDQDMCKGEEERIGGPRKKMILLRLDYEGVIAAWASQGSPWTTGNRPKFDPNESWPDCMGSQWNEGYGVDGSGMVVGQGGGMGDGGREARVSRYREKRRTRLFSKKIRYEVRKLNAEKRPRMKGRFVKRAAFAASAFSLINK